MAASSDGKDKGCVDNKLTLWVGNLDKRLSENKFDCLSKEVLHVLKPIANLNERYNLLKILQRFGEIKSFDLHFHKSGAREGEPSYCFVEFKTFQEAENALLGLNGKLALSKPLSVNWARKQTGEAGKKEKDKAIPTTPSSSQSSLDSCDSKIRAIEAKLKLMESGHKNDLSSRGKHPLLVQSEQVRSHPYKKQERYRRGRGRHAR